jgi:hypothetical protein
MSGTWFGVASGMNTIKRCVRKKNIGLSVQNMITILSSISKHEWGRGGGLI